jgi:hypothetical protein
MHASKRKGSKSWTLLLVGELGKTSSFRLSRSTVATLMLGVATAFALMVFLTVSHFVVRSENRALKTDLGKMRADLLSANEAKEKALVRSMLEEEPVGPDEKNDDSSHKEPSKKASEGLTPSGPPGEETRVVASQETKPVSEPSSAKPKTSEGLGPILGGSVAVEKLRIRPVVEGHFLEYEFVVKNTDPQGRTIKGYAFVVLRPEEGSGEWPAVSPSTPLKDGRPVIFKKGQYFSISRFKPLRGTFPGAATVEPFKTATVYVYSQTGSVLVEQVHQVDKISGS